MGSAPADGVVEWVVGTATQYANRVLPLAIILTVIATAWFVIYYVVLIRFKFFRELMGIEAGKDKKRRPPKKKQ